MTDTYSESSQKANPKNRWASDEVSMEIKPLRSYLEPGAG